MLKADIHLLCGKWVISLFAGVALWNSGACAASDFAANPPGELRTATGQGRKDATVYAPGITFPIEQAPSYLNSQVYSTGGYWSHPSNYQYPWWDNFCERRGWKTPMCPSGSGHQGQDIRPKTKVKSVHWVVAVEDGQITYISPKPGFVVRLKGSGTGNLYNYLHMDMSRLTVRQGDEVKAGQRIGLVSNDFGGTSTSVHLHFEILQAQRGVSGVRHVPPYKSLVDAYTRKIHQ
jgi:murein DD-endopeptidase MepM/ murein hydrolase activator NlpD